MPITLGLNIASLKGQRQLARSSEQLSSVFERLSSGQRINRASDDAAGLAIAESLNADRRVFTQGVRNLNDGLSALTIADGSLSELSAIVIRLSELAEQSANGPLGTKQREALDEEAQALSDEYFRIVQSTEFNGRSLFTADYGELRLQAGYGLEGSLADNLGGALGTGVLSDPTSETNAGGQVEGIALGDLNGDGNQDLVITSAATDEIFIQLGNGDGTFGAKTGYAVGDSPHQLELGDLDGDGVLDIVVADRSDDTVTILRGNGDGTVTSQGTVYLNDNGSGDGPVDVTIGDLNNDGRLDIGVAAQSTSSFVLLENEGDFNFRVAYENSSGAGSTTGINFFDADNDGNLDIAVSGSGGAAVFTSNGSGGYGSFFGDTFIPDLSINTISAFSFDVATGDVNGDGNGDLIALDSGFNRLDIRLGRADRSFDPVISFTTDDDVVGVSLGDLNGDGNLDIITRGNDGAETSIAVHLNDGNADFAQFTSYSTGFAGTTANQEDLVLGDINNDGVLDVITTYGSRVISFTTETQSGIQPLLPFDLNTIAGAKQALSEFSQKLDQLAEQRGQIGAFMARIETASTTLGVASENYAAAESRIRDADIAFESSQLTRLNILQQAASAVLAQANIQPQLALLLLGGGS